MYDIVANKIGEQWKDLAEAIGTPADTIELINNLQLTGEHSYKEKMTRCLKTKKHGVSWRHLKHSLKRLKRKDIVLEIESNTFITEGNILFVLVHFFYDSEILWVLNYGFCRRCQRQ